MGRTVSATRRDALSWPRGGTYCIIRDIPTHKIRQKPSTFEGTYGRSTLETRRGDVHGLNHLEVFTCGGWGTVGI